MAHTPKISQSETPRKALESLLVHCKADPNLQNDKNVHIIMSMSRKMGVQNDSIPRIIPLTSCKLNKPKDLRILLITKDPSTIYRETLTKDDATADLFKEIISLKGLKRRFRGVKMNQIYKEFDLLVADFRVHHLLPAVLGSRFYSGNKKLPYVIRMSKEIMSRGKKSINECDAAYVRAQLRSICRNTSYVPNNDNCLSVKIGEVNKTPLNEMLQNIQDILNFLTDKTKKPQGGIVKGEITSIFVKTTNSPSLPIYEIVAEPASVYEDDDLRL